MNSSWFVRSVAAAMRLSKSSSVSFFMSAPSGNGCVGTSILPRMRADTQQPTEQGA